jgi:hypothetical protein
MNKGRLLLSAAASALLAVCGATAGTADNYNPSSEAFKKLKISTAENEQAAALGTYHTIAVIPDDGDWASAQPTTLFLPFHLEAEVSKTKWRIKDSYITIGVAPIQSGGLLFSFDPANYAARVEHGDTKHFDKDGWWSAKVTASNSIGMRARNACRNLRKELAQQGMKHAEIFGQDRSTILPTEFRYSARVAHKNDYYDLIEASTMGSYWMQTQPYWININVVCKKAGMVSDVQAPTDPTPIPTGSNDIAMGFQVNQAALAISPKPYTGKCPAKIHLNPTIEATGKGTVKYRFVDQLGNHSQTFQVKFDKSDVKFLDHVIEIDGKNAPKGLGFKAPQPKSGELGLAAPSDANLTQGYFRVEVLSPHKKLSNIADYSVKCTFKVAGNGKLAAPKDVVKPVIVGGLTVGLADLVIEDVQPSPAVPTKLFVKVTNKGKAASTPTNLRAIRWTGNQATGRGTLVPAIQPGQSQVVLAELGGTIAGATQLYVRVDDPNRVPESDDGNNSFKVK